MNSAVLDAVKPEPDAPLATLPFGLMLELHVADPELVQELQAFAEGKPRDDYALCALKIGLLALKQARGQIDADTVRQEGERLLTRMGGHLDSHAKGLENALSTTLRAYFDPESGRLHERVHRLVRKDGELEEVLRRQIGQQDSELSKTLAAHFGAHSPLMKMLSPKESEGLLKLLSDTLAEQLRSQRERVLSEFSMDNQEGALSKLVARLTQSHGELGKDLQTRIDAVVGEFSLDKEDSALNRLVRMVTEAQRTISGEFSLDNETSALRRMSNTLENTRQAINSHLTLDKEDSSLARLKRELIHLLTEHSSANQRFQEEVKATLAELRTRREEAARSPGHGKDFEQSVFAFVQRDGQPAGEIATFVGDNVGEIKNCKVGDVLIEMGPDHVAAAARIVVEAKDKAAYTLAKAREEIEEGRKNRAACVGLFVFSRQHAPEGIEAFQRIGDDLFVTWDPADSRTDIYLQAGLMVARALCTRQARQQEARTADFTGIDKAILAIEKSAGTLDEITTSANSIKTGADKILKRVQLARDGIVGEVQELRELIEGLKSEVAGTNAPRLT
jgi:hypothetical protein